MIAQLKQFLQNVKQNPEYSDAAYRKGNTLYINGQCQLMTQSKYQFEFSIDEGILF